MLILCGKIHILKNIECIRNSFSYAAIELIFIQKNASIFHVAWDFCGHYLKNIIKFGPLFVSNIVFYRNNSIDKTNCVAYIKLLYLLSLHFDRTLVSLSVGCFSAIEPSFQSVAAPRGSEILRRTMQTVVVRVAERNKTAPNKVPAVQPSVFPRKCLRPDPSSPSISIEK